MGRLGQRDYVGIYIPMYVYLVSGCRYFVLRRFVVTFSLGT